MARLVGHRCRCSFNRSATTRRADLDSTLVDRSTHSCSNLFTKLDCLPLPRARDTATQPVPQISNSFYCSAIFFAPCSGCCPFSTRRAPNQPTNQPKDTTTSLPLSPAPDSHICKLDPLRHQILRSPRTPLSRASNRPTDGPTEGCDDDNDTLSTK